MAVSFERRGRSALITIERPEARNAVNSAVASGIEAALDRLEAEDDLWVGVLAGRGPVFCAGADLKEVSSGGFGGQITARGGFAGIVRRQRTKPVIAAVDGPALAGGCEIVLACDLVVASAAARFGIPEVSRSLVAAAGGLLRLPRYLPPNVAMEMALTGDPIEAERAHALGLVNRLVAPGQAVEAALELAERVCQNAPLAVRASRQVVKAAAAVAEDELWRLSDQALSSLYGTEDMAEGPRAFVEKWPPVWKGR